MDEIAIKIENVTKEYRLGTIGGGTLREDLQSWWARKRGKEDPNSRIGSKQMNYEDNDRFLALDGVSFDVKKGERVAVIGHNGAGKSTLLKLLSRVTAPTSGTISYNGRIASMLEVGTGFHRELTGRENIYMNGAILGMTKKEIDEKIEDIIEFSECRQFIDTPVKRYSSGMYVKLAFSVAAHLDSEIMIMDEVLAVGDMSFQKKCLNKMNDISRKDGRTILYVSHNMNTVRQLCDRVIVLDHGKVIFNGDVEEGIGIYLGDDLSSENTTIDYTKISRLDWLKDTKIKTKRISFLEKNDNIFDHNEPLAMRIEWENEDDVSNLGVRIEILDYIRNGVASVLLYDFYSGKKGFSEYFDISVSIDQFVSGKYNTNITFFFTDEFGNNVDVDCVHGLSFTVNNTDNKIVWSRKKWGSIILPSPYIKERSWDKNEH